MTKSSKKTAKNKNIAATIFKSNETIRTAAQICVSAVCLLMCFTIFKSGIAFYICAAVGYLSVFVNIFVSSIKNIVKGEIFDEFFLLVIASVGAILLGQYTEAVAVTLFFTIGEFFEKIATEKSKNTVKSLSAMIPDTVDVDFGGEYKTISAFDVKKGDVFRVTAGKRVPLDGIILSGESNLDASALTGESLPIFVKGGDTIKSGCIVADGELKVRASEIFLQSTVSKILQMTEEEQEKKSAPVAFITKFSKIYTPSVIGFAAIIAVFLPMILDVTYAESVYRALSFLVISCPCALVVSVPLSFFAGIGTAAKHGVLVKGSSVLEDLAGISQIAYDKTGTITDGSFEISVQGSEKTLEYAAYAEAFSSHPIAKSIKSAYGKKIDENRVCNCKEVAGFGITAVLDEKPLLCGRIELLESAGIKKSGDINKICTKSSSSAEIYVGYDKNFVGTIKLKEKIKPETECAFKKNRKLGIKKQIILSGDCFSAVNEISKNVGADGFFARLMPDEKAKKVIELKKCGKVAFVGDGINDAPVLTAADVGIAMGGLGSEAAIDASDAVIMGDSLKKIPFAIELSRKVCKIAKINIIFVIFIKFLILLLSAAGIVGMWAAVFADVGALIIAVLNSMTIFFKSEK